MDLIIVESPHKAKTISKYLGKQYMVMASGGHIRDLPEHRMGIDIEHDFKPEYVITESKKNIIDSLRKAMGKAQKVYLASDPDREGEAISWHISQVFDLADGDIRIEFNEISKKAVLAALQHPRKINLNLVNAQQARRVLDRLVGYEVSPILSRKIKSGLSAGRVQSVALKMVVDREREIRDFVPEEYWNIFAFLLKYAQADVRKNAGKQKESVLFSVLTEKEEQLEALADWMQRKSGIVQRIYPECCMTKDFFRNGRLKEFFQKLREDGIEILTK